MLRLTVIFIAVCVVLISASLSAVVYLIFGLSGWESATVGVAALAALALVNTVTSRLRDRGDVGSQITDLSRGMADLARQTAEVSRRLAAVEIEVGASERRAKAVTQPLTGEISELGNLVRHLAETVAAQEAAIAALKGGGRAEAAVSAATEGEERAAGTPVTVFKAASLAPKADAAEPKALAGTGYFKGKSPEEVAAFIRAALEANRLDVHLQPILTLPQRKVRYYEALARLRSEDGDVVPAADFIAHATGAGLIAKIDNAMLFRCVQVLRRLLVKDREIGLFCNVSAATLADPEIFPQFFQFMEANRAIAPSLMLEFTQDSMRGMGLIEQEALSALAERGFRFSIDHVHDLRMEPRDLSDRGVRFVKVQATVLLNRAQAPADIHSADLSDLLGRFGISLIADRIETEAVVVDLLDYDVRFGQGHLFSPPRPVRAESLQGPAERGDFPMREALAAGGGPAKVADKAAEKAAEAPAPKRAAI